MTPPASVLPLRLRCPLCLAERTPAEVEFLCPPECGDDRRHPLAEMPRPTDLGAPIFLPQEQSAICPPCGRTLTGAGFAGCTEVAPLPLGIPAGNIVHVAVVALDDEERTLRVTAAALMRALAVQDALPADSYTYGRWGRDALQHGTIATYAGDRPLVVRLGGRGGRDGEEGGPRFVCLHPFLMRTLAGDQVTVAWSTGCAAAAAMTPVARLVQADQIMVSVSAAHALSDGPALTQAAAALAALLPDGGAPLPRGWICLAGQEDLFLRLGPGAARPHELAGRPAPERAAVLAGYVGGSARLDDTLAPLASLRWPALGHVMFGVPLDAKALAGLEPWAAAAGS